ncbi:hypothetical protein H6G41_14600 [Tolypothrix sp. FACHB-123]|uniref:hypothetical protein n=1 Tax=Tolypothrix sp. FACHB-123 TaxID=2692868 RepID=UPI001684AFD9|nr:hypothetical protein [Tolypothrix sp. FACHB-123]MBD2355831.1 hypothetical protein [Tolypothrix sp. FACHB-123]
MPIFKLEILEVMTRALGEATIADLLSFENYPYLKHSITIKLFKKVIALTKSLRDIQYGS